MQPLTLIFVGPQGSGKGTQISKIKNIITALDGDRKLVDVQTGSLFRSLTAPRQTFAQNKIADSLQAGVLQPDFLTYALWGQQMLSELDPGSHLLIDGFPRTVAQAETLAGAFDFFERKNIHVINLDTPEEVVKARMLERARDDDTLESIENRLRWYREDTLPVIAYYKNIANVTVHDIKGDDTIDGVHEQIISALKLK